MRVPSGNVFYLDSNIIVAFYLEDDDANQHERILKCLNKLALKDNIILIALFNKIEVKRIKWNKNL